jgi:hypothetical protein
MKNSNGALLGFVGGSVYLTFLFVMAWKGVAPFSTIGWFSVASLVTFALIIPLAFWFPVSSIWLYPFWFALPMLLIGLLALTGGIPAGIVIGAVTFLAGLAAAYVARELDHIFGPRSNPALKRAL